MWSSGKELTYTLLIEKAINYKNCKKDYIFNKTDSWKKHGDFKSFSDLYSLHGSILQFTKTFFFVTDGGS
jgi:hypothetical protein